MRILLISLLSVFVFTAESQICTKSQLPANLQNGLVAFYPFCGNANDASGNGFNGTVNGATLTTDRFGAANSAYYFDGFTKITVPHNSTLNLLNDITISAWVLSDGPPLFRNSHTFISKRSSTEFNSFPYLFGINYQFGIPTEYKKQIFTSASAPGFYQYLQPSIDITNSIWQHHVVTISGAQIKFYLDGILTHTTTVDNSKRVSNIADLLIGSGARPDLPSEQMIGKLDDIFIYNKAISGCEVSQLYNATSTSIPDIQTFSFNPLSDTTRVCGTTTSLDAGSGYASYSWNTGATIQTIPATTSGFYKVIVTNAAGCTASDSTYLSLVNANIINNDTTICKGSSITLSIDSLFPGRTVCNANQLPANLRNGLVGYWPFCGNANDESGNGNNGVVNGAVLASDRFATQSSAYLFNGQANRIVVSNSTALNPQLISVGAWVRPRAFGPSEQYIINKSFDVNGNNSARNWGVRVSGDGKLTLEVKVNGQYYIFNDPVAGRLILNDWNLIVFTYDGITANLYCNSILAITQPLSGTLTTQTYALNIGYLPHPNMPPFGYFWNGEIDDVFIYNRCLSQAELQQFYNTRPSVTWSPVGATTNSITVSPTQTTTYYVTVSDGITTCTDSVKVTVSDISTFNPLSDTTRVCGTSTALNAGPGFASYSWNTTATIQTIPATASGFYKVTVTNAAGCTASDSTYLSLVNANILNNDTTICKGSSITLSIDSLFPGRTVCNANQLPANLRNGLVGYWPFCGNANDASGNGNNGVVNGATLNSDRFNATNSSYYFNGISDFIRVNNSSSIQTPNGITMNLWVQFRGLGLQSPRLFSKGWSPNGIELHTESNNNQKIRFGGTFSGAGYGPLSQTTLADGLWYMITAVDDGQAKKIYVNGILEGSLTHNYGSIPVTAVDLLFGRNSQLTTDFFNGSIDDVVLWNRPLTATEVAQLFSPSPSVTWSPGGATTNSITVSPTQTTTYYVTVTDGITTCTDSVKVTVSTVDTSLTLLDPPQLCATGGQVRLQAGTASSYQWLLNGTAIPGATAQTYNATQSGTYRVALVNALGCRDTSRAVTITVNPNPTVNAVNNTAVCNGANFAGINFSGSVAGTVYSWTNNNTSIGLAASGTGNLPSFPAVNTGTSPITATITVTPSYTNGGLTCTGTAITFTITVNPTPTVNAVSNQSVCNGAATTAISFSGAVTGTVYSWTNTTTSIGLAASGTGNIASFTALNSTAAPITATITVTPSYTNGGVTCSGTPRSFTITVNPTATATLANPGTSVICQGSSVTLTASGGSTYQWFLNGNIIPGATAATYPATLPGIYTVIPISAFSCTGTVSNAITLSLISRPTADFSFDKYCAGFPTNFTNLSQVNGSGVVGYAWSFGDGNTSTLVNPSNVYAQTGSYSATLLVTPLACPALTSTITKPVVISPPPANIRYPSLNAVTNRNLQLQARLFTGAGYQWIPSVGLNNATIQTPIFNYNQQQQYLIRINTTEGCVITDTLLVRMFTQREIYLPTTFSPNGDGANDVLTPRLVGIADLIYFRVYDRWGQLMYQTTQENQGWDGIYKGTKQPMETYAWMAEGKDIDGNIIKRSGTVILLR
jgi:gliding motility-associated-like protein